jgi:hypothetical protein
MLVSRTSMHACMHARTYTQHFFSFSFSVVIIIPAVIRLESRHKRSICSCYVTLYVHLRFSFFSFFISNSLSTRKVFISQFFDFDIIDSFRFRFAYLWNRLMYPLFHFYMNYCWIVFNAANACFRGIIETYFTHHDLQFT